MWTGILSAIPGVIQERPRVRLYREDGCFSRFTARLSEESKPTLSRWRWTSALGFPQFITVGLPDPAVRESKERVRAALKNCGYDVTSRKITINLAPADRRKEGSAFDLPISLGFLADLGIFPAESLRDYLFVGELALDGRLKPVPGVLPIALLVKKKGFRGIVVPKPNEREAVLVPDLDVFALDNLVQVVEFLNGSSGHPALLGPAGGPLCGSRSTTSISRR